MWELAIVLTFAVLGAGSTVTAIEFKKEVVSQRRRINSLLAHQHELVSSLNNTRVKLAQAQSTLARTTPSDIVNSEFAKHTAEAISLTEKEG